MGLSSLSCSSSSSSSSSSSGPCSTSLRKFRNANFSNDLARFSVAFIALSVTMPSSIGRSRRERDRERRQRGKEKRERRQRGKEKRERENERGHLMTAAEFVRVKSECLNFYGVLESYIYIYFFFCPRDMKAGNDFFV